MQATKGMSVIAGRAVKKNIGIVASATPQATPAVREAMRPIAWARSPTAAIANEANGKRIAHSVYSGSSPDPRPAPTNQSPSAPSHGVSGGLLKNQFFSQNG